MTASVADTVQALLDCVVAADPLTATQLGLPDGLDRLPDYGEAAMRGLAVALREFEPSLLSAAAGDDLADATDAVMGVQIVRRVARDVELRRVHRRDPVVHLDAAYAILLTMIKQIAPLGERVDFVRGRLVALADLLDAAPAILDDVVPRVFVESALDDIPGARELVGEAARGFAREAGREGDLDEASRVAEGAVQRYGHYLRERLLPIADESYAAGREVLTAILRDEHLLGETPEQIAAVGRATIAETQAAMAELAAATGHDSVAAAVAAAQLAHPSADGLLPGYRRAVAAARAFIVDHDLLTLPAAEELIVDPTPSFMRASLPFAGYEGPGPFDADLRGFYWVTAPASDLSDAELESALRAHPSASLPTVGVHEAYPGHHTQYVRAAGAPSLARRIAYVPSGGTLSAEGWAFYCEEMMEAQGFLADPAVRLMRLNDQLWRACRVVIDMELHLGSMTFDEAVDLLAATAHLGRAEAELEVRWYVRSPGYPMSYLIGKRELLDLSRDWSRRHTTSLKTFHDALLDWGFAPPAVIRWGMGLGERPVL